MRAVLLCLALVVGGCTQWTSTITLRTGDVVERSGRCAEQPEAFAVCAERSNGTTLAVVAVVVGVVVNVALVWWVATFPERAVRT